jgi:hypothetical protein
VTTAKQWSDPEVTGTIGPSPDRPGLITSDLITRDRSRFSALPGLL